MSQVTSNCGRDAVDDGKSFELLVEGRWRAQVLDAVVLADDQESHTDRPSLQDDLAQTITAQAIEKFARTGVFEAMREIWPLPETPPTHGRGFRRSRGSGQSTGGLNTGSMPFVRSNSSAVVTVEFAMSTWFGFARCAISVRTTSPASSGPSVMRLMVIAVPPLTPPDRGIKPVELIERVVEVAAGEGVEPFGEFDGGVVHPSGLGGLLLGVCAGDCGVFDGG
ncbi:hypothetical protein P3H15_51545 [Rhodococcus sp. T2V]|uniref:hypothetical protein n=1 Tax=Rhodococcus sp. T2V TaxID=3034164 RepID=UPI0023E0FEBD|nr:hypothetical protein [Rhodococcus sp. T2V]MDF3313352.1 hypothetical protein [Rhodococcus sp. T2V]